MPITRIPSNLLDTSNVAINAFIGGVTANGLYTLCLYTPFSGNVISTIATSNVGTCTLTYTVNGKNLPNVINITSGSETKFIANQSSNIAFTTGQTISVYISNASPTCANVSMTIFCQKSGK